MERPTPIPRVKLDGTVKVLELRERECGRCGSVKPAFQWPRGKTGARLRHCGCVSRNPSDPWTKEKGKAQNRARRARLAAAAGKQYRTRDQIIADRAVKAASAPKQRPRKHDAHVAAYRKWQDAIDYRERYRTDPEFNIKERLRRQLRKKSEAVPGVAEMIACALKRVGNSPRVEALLGYSIADLKLHIERQFTKGMSWAVWSKDGIHIDHILPRKCFDLTTTEGVQAYWSLSNLRPLWSGDNLKKQARVEFLC